MSGLYNRLFTYRERADRSPLEDFLTEALADLLNRFPEPLARRAVELLISDRSDALQNLEQFWPAGAKATWTTQKIIDGGKIIDLLMEVDGKPLVVVENKISAGFQEHRPHPSSVQGAEVEHQLATYGRWLTLETPPDWGGALILLTHWTPAPADFVTCTQTYCTRYRNTIRWSDFSRWLRDETKMSGHSQADWVALSVDLVGFLRKRDMDHERATSHDLAALQIYVASADRVRKSIEDIWESVKQLWRPICQQTDQPLEISTRYGCVWKWRYLVRNDLRSSYLAFGIRFPDLAQDRADTTLGGNPYFFVELGSEAKSSAITDLKMPSGWIVSKDLRISTRPVRDFATDPDCLVLEAQAWTRERMHEVVRALG